MLAKTILLEKILKPKFKETIKYLWYTHPSQSVIATKQNQQNNTTQGRILLNNKSKKTSEMKQNKREIE